MLFERSKSRKSGPGVVLADPVVEFVDGQFDAALAQLAATPGDFAVIRADGGDLYNVANVGRLVDTTRRFKVLFVIGRSARDVQMMIHAEQLVRHLQVAEMFGGQR